MGTFESEFELEQKIKTKFGEEGFIENISFSKRGIIYWVQVSMKTGSWLRPDEITAL